MWHLHISTANDACFSFRQNAGCARCCQMACFHNKNTNLGIFWMGLNGKCWYILLLFGILYCHLVQFMSIWHILWMIGIYLPVFECCSRKKSGIRLGYIMDDFFDKRIRSPCSGPILRAGGLCRLCPVFLFSSALTDIFDGAMQSV
jgi:hypothetical protein